MAGEGRSFLPGIVRPARLARALRNPVRRVALAVVLDRLDPVSVPSLAPAVVDYADGFGTPRTPRCGDLCVALRDRHLPLLAGAGLVSRSDGGRLVRPRDPRLRSYPAFEPERLCGDDRRWRALAAVFGQPRRRVAVAAIRRLGTPVSVERLARAVAAERVGELGRDAPVIEDLARRFHHVDLPLLADADVLTYDAEERRIRRASAAVLPPGLAAV